MGTLSSAIAGSWRGFLDAFSLSLEEIADVLGTTVGAVKAALHRGRGKLADPEPEPTRVPAPGVLDAFRSAFNAADLDALASLLLDEAAVEVVGATTRYGRAAARETVRTSWGASNACAPARPTPACSRKRSRGCTPFHGSSALLSET